MRRASVAIALVFVLGVAAGWWLASRFYAERFSAMKEQRTLLEGRIKALQDAQPRPQAADQQRQTTRDKD